MDITQLNGYTEFINSLTNSGYQLTEFQGFYIISSANTQATYTLAEMINKISAYA